MTEVSCWNCNHRWVCKKWDIAQKYIDAEWGGIHYKEIAEEMAKLVGRFCPKYQPLKECPETPIAVEVKRLQKEIEYIANRWEWCKCGAAHHARYILKEQRCSG